MSSPASRSAVPVARVSRVSTTRARRFSIKTRHIGQLGWLARSLRHYRASGSVVEACVALGSVGRGYSDPASASESSTLKSWRTRVVARTGVRKAKVALARKLGVVLHRMLADGTEFLPDKAAAAVAPQQIQGGFSGTAVQPSVARAHRWSTRPLRRLAASSSRSPTGGS